MMYLLFNNQGVLIEKQINQWIIQGSNNVNKIGVVIEGIDTTSYTLTAICKLPNGESVTFEAIDDVEEIKDGVNGVVFPLPDSVTALQGTIRINIKAISNITDKSITSYTVFLCVNEGVDPGEIVMMTAQQYETLLRNINMQILADETIVKIQGSSAPIYPTDYELGQNALVVSSDHSFAKLYQLEDGGWSEVFDFNITLNFYTMTQTNSLLNEKVDKEEGKELTTNDFTDAFKNKLNALPTITELNAEFSGKVDKVSGSSLVPDTKITAYDNHLEDTSNPHSVTKSQVGLGNVDNTGDSDTPTANGTSKFTTGGAYVLQQEINNLKNIGRFLAIWNANTGVAATNPPESPYTYKTGDYFRVGTGGDRIPTGSSYTIGGTNYTTTSEALALGDLVYFDGTVWQRQAKGQGGDVYDVQVDGTSILAGGYANLTKTTLAPVLAYTNANPTTVAVGGIPAGTTFSNKSVFSILEDMLYPYVAFSGFSITSNAESYPEYGTAQTITSITPHFTPGSKAITSFKITSNHPSSPHGSGTEYYSGNSATNGTAVTLTTPISWDGRNGMTIYAQISDGTTTKTTSLYFSPTYSEYYATSSSTTAPDQLQDLTEGDITASAGETISYAAGDYLYFYKHSAGSSATIQTEVYTDTWTDATVGTTYVGSVTIENSAGVQVSYDCYRTTNPMAGAGSGKFRLNY